MYYTFKAFVELSNPPEAQDIVSNATLLKDKLLLLALPDQILCVRGGYPPSVPSLFEQYVPAQQGNWLHGKGDMTGNAKINEGEK